MIEVCAAIVEFEGKILITSRPLSKDFAGCWEFPGGKIESGESHSACLQRELLEELNLAVKVGDLFDEVDFHYPHKSVHLYFYRCTCSSVETLLPKEGQNFAWVARADLSNYVFLEADISVVKRLF